MWQTVRCRLFPPMKKRNLCWYCEEPVHWSTKDWFRAGHWHTHCARRHEREMALARRWASKIVAEHTCGPDKSDVANGGNYPD